MTGIAAQKEPLRSPLLDAERKAGADAAEAGPPASPGDARREDASAALVVLGVPWARSMLAFCFFWDLARASLSFLGPYYVNDATHDPFLVELAGAASWIFLVAGPSLGAVSDRWDRRAIMRSYTAVMGLGTVGVALLALAGEATWRLMFLLMPLLSVCSVLDSTTRMPFASDLLAASQQDHLLGTLVAIRTVGYNIARVLGCQLVGVIVDYSGFGMSFLFIAVHLFAAMLFSLQLPKFAKAGSGSGGQGAVAGRASLWSRALVSVLGVTVIANFFYWSCLPLIPALGTGLGASPSGIGFLGSAPYLGGLLVSMLLVRWNPRRTGALYCLGITLADLALAGAAAPSFSTAFGGLLCAGGSASLFGTVQVALVMGMAPAELRGRAMGLLSLAISAGPFGMAALGRLAASFGAGVALSRFALAGALCQALWLCFLPDALYVQRPS